MEKWKGRVKISPFRHGGTEKYELVQAVSTFRMWKELALSRRDAINIESRPRRKHRSFLVT